MASWRFKLLYDGACPFCRREVEWLERRDRAGRLAAEDISALGFDPTKYGLCRDEVARVLHGVKPDGSVLKGMEAVREAYGTVGLGWLVAPTRLPLLRTASNCLYRLFARYRMPFGRLLTGERSGRTGGCSEETCAAK
jgi:predicted DCC family thiol-disulfide oxidoreductase YuxK